MEIYAGKQPEGSNELSNSPKYVVHRLIKLIVNIGRNVTADNWFISIPHAKELLLKELTLVVTLRKKQNSSP